MAEAEAYLLAKFHFDPSIRLATIHQRPRQTDRQTHRQDRTDNGPIAYDEPFYKRSPKTSVKCNPVTGFEKPGTYVNWVAY